MLCSRMPTYFYSMQNKSIVLLVVLANLLQDYMDVFPPEIPPRLPLVRGIEHKFGLIPTASLPNHATYKTNLQEDEDYQQYIWDLLGHEYFRESLNPYSIQVFLVPKKDDFWHMCVDYRAINNITIQYRHPTPRLEEMFEELSGYDIF